MYLSYFGLNHKPFAQVPQTQCLFPATTTIEAMENLRFGLLTQHSISLLTAGPGLGKSLILQAVTEELANTHKPVYLATTGIPGRAAFLQAILFELKRPYAHLGEQELRLSLIAAARDIQQTRLGIVLLLDELHLADDDVLMEIRTLTTFSELGRPLFSVIGAGQIDLEDRLTQSKHEPFNQKIGAHVLLNPLSRSETARYIRHQIEWAGGSVDTIFTVDALELIAQACEGIPRKINLLCDQALMLAYAHSESLVDRELVESTLNEITKTQINTSYNWQNNPETSSTYTLKNETVESASNQMNSEIQESTMVSFEVGFGVKTAPAIDTLRQPLTSASTATIVHELATLETKPTLEIRTVPQTLKQNNNRPKTEIEEFVITDRYTQLDYKRQQLEMTSPKTVTKTAPVKTKLSELNIIPDQPEISLHNTILELQDMTQSILSVDEDLDFSTDSTSLLKYDVVMPADEPIIEESKIETLQIAENPVVEEVVFNVLETSIPVIEEAQIEQTSANLRLDNPTPVKKSRSFKTLFSKLRNQQ